MRFAYLCAFTSVSVIISTISGMEGTLKRLAAEQVVKKQGDAELPEEVIHCMIVDSLSQSLPTAYHTLTKRYVLQKRRPDEPESSKCTYLSGQAKMDLGKVTGMTFVGDSSLVFVFGSSGVIQCWDTTKKELLYEKKHATVYSKPCASLDGEKVAAISGATATVWYFRSADQSMVFTAEESLVCIEFDQEGRSLITCDAKGKVIIWDIETKKQIDSFMVNDHERIMGIRKVNDNVVLFGGTQVTVWNSLKKTLTTKSIEIGYFRCVASMFKDDTKIAFVLSNNTIILYDWQNVTQQVLTIKESFSYKGEERKTPVMSVRSFCLSLDEQLMVLGEFRRVSLWKRLPDNQYEFVGSFAGGSQCAHIALRNDNFAYVAAELNGGLTLYSLAALENQGVISVRKVLAENVKAKGLYKGLPADWHTKQKNSKLKSIENVDN